MKRRFPLVDTLRGFALLIMFAYHFCFDLHLFGAAALDFNAPFWVAYRTLILTLFLGLVGVGLALGDRAWPDPLRVLRLALCAGAVSLGTRLLFPREWVFFGVLHFVLMASLLGPLLARAPWACLGWGAPLLVLPWFYRSPALDGGLRQLTGFCAHRPSTIDFVPLAPWLGVVLLGIFIGSRIPRGASWLGSGNPHLAQLGRHSLLFYMLHQGALLPLAWLVAQFMRALPP